nr:DNA-binding protein [Lachnospiraceae bacterium]
MTKDLTTSRIDRQNILNNEMAIEEIQDKSGITGIAWDGKIYLTREAVASFFDVDIRTISRYIEQYNDELTENGYVVLRGQRLKSFLDVMPADFAKDINVPSKIRQLGLFDFRAFLNMAMLLSESEKARALRQLMLDIVIDLINRRTGGGTKYINQRDKDYIGSALQEENYRRQFTDALKLYVAEDRYKYAHFTDMIYVSIFKEKAHEYKKILDLKASDKVRDTFYSEILDIIAAYESGLADAIKKEYESLGHILSISEAEQLFQRFESMALWKPLINRGRTKMASRDMALRDAFHYQLSEYIQPLDKDEYQKFLGAAGDELERLMAENQDVLKRLKERE